MSTSSRTKEEEIKNQVQEEWKSKLSAWGLSAFGCAVRFHRRFVSGFVFPQKRIFYHICATSVFIYTFSMTRSPRRQLASPPNAI